MEIKNETKLTKELNNEFQHVHSAKLMIRVQIICYSLLVALSVLFFFKDIIIAVAILIAIPVSYFVTLWLQKVIKNRVNNSNLMIQEEPKMLYSFGDDVIKIETQSRNSLSSSTLTYQTVYKVLFSKNLTAIYINKINAYILDNNSFTSGTIEELKKLLQQKIDTKRIKNGKK